MLALDVLRVRALVRGAVRDAVCEFRNPPFDKTVEVKRDGSDRNRFVTASKPSAEAPGKESSQFSRIGIWFEELQPKI